MNGTTVTGKEGQSNQDLYQICMKYVYKCKIYDRYDMNMHEMCMQYARNLQENMHEKCWICIIYA